MTQFLWGEVEEVGLQPERPGNDNAPEWEVGGVGEGGWVSLG